MGFFSSLGKVVKSVASPIASVIGTGADLFSAKSARDESKQQAANAMSYQADMSGSAHQREVDDLRKAGLNPILSAKYGGASTPIGHSAPIQPVTSGTADKLRQGVESYYTTAHTKANTALVASQTNKANAEAISAAARASVDMQSAGMDTSKLGRILMQADKILAPLSRGAGIAAGAALGSAYKSFRTGGKMKKLINKARKRDRMEFEFKPGGK